MESACLPASVCIIAMFNWCIHVVPCHSICWIINHTHYLNWLGDFIDQSSTATTIQQIVRNTITDATCFDKSGLGTSHQCGLRSGRYRHNTILDHAQMNYSALALRSMGHICKSMIYGPVEGGPRGLMGLRKLVLILRRSLRCWVTTHWPLSSPLSLRTIRYWLILGGHGKYWSYNMAESDILAWVWACMGLLVDAGISCEL